MLTEDERMKLAERWMEVAPEGFKVIVHVGSTCVKSSKRLAEHAQKIGAWGIGAMAPPFPKVGRIEELVKYCEEIACGAPALPFYFYHIPAFNGAFLSMVAFLEAVDGRIPNFAGIKYTFESLYEYNQCRLYKNGKFDMLHGQDETILPCLAMGGAQGGIGGTTNYNGKELTGIIEAWKAGDLELARERQNFAQEVINVICHYRGNIVGGKRIMKLIGLLEILNAKSDLSRRAIVYEMQGFSFREYLNWNEKLSLPILTLNNILDNHLALSVGIVDKVKVLKHFSDYLKHGYYPYYNELPSLYYSRINEVVNLIVELEIPQLRGVDISYTTKIKQLLYIIAESAPFIPNVSKLSERIGISRNSLLAYLDALHDSCLTMNLQKEGSGISRLQKPDKLFLENPNLMYALSASQIDIGNVRETFFANQLRYCHKINVSKESDFFIDGRYTFEVGGRHKGKQQINGLSDAYIVADDIEYGINNKIPLWLFGFLY